MSSYHKSVLLQEVLTALHVQKDKKYIDATLGGAGHSSEIAKLGGLVLGIDQDADALEEARKRRDEEGLGERLKIAQGNFDNIENIAKTNGFEKVSGILFDIGVSSHQLDTNARGFSFLSSGPLDMRMDMTKQVTAADLVNGLHKGELIDLFAKYGEEPFARRIADLIVTKRQEKRIETTDELADLIAQNVKKIGKTHPATRVFQALRIAVNDELYALENGLRQAVGLLESKGRLVVITFHSLEDRIVKNIFLEFEEKKLGIIGTKKPIIPTNAEIETNKRSRSAKMRVLEKI